MKLEHSLILHTKINSECNKYLNVRSGITQFLEENIGRTPSDINHSNKFLHPSPQVMKIKTKINKQYLIKLKRFCIAKETINKTKRQPTEWERIFANEGSTDKGLISLVNSSHSSILKKKKKNQKMGRGLKKTSLQIRHTDGKKTHEKMLNITIREMYIKTTKDHFTPVRMTIIKISTKNKCQRGCGEKGILLHCWWECKFLQSI